MLSPDIEIPADQWESYCLDMAAIQQELYELWIADMEKEAAAENESAGCRAQ